MVSKSRLAVAVLTLLACALMAQQTETTSPVDPYASTIADSVFIKARVDTPGVLPMPANWKEPLTSVALLSVEVLPDTTLGAITVINAEPPLDSLAIAAVEQAPLRAAMLNGVPVVDTVRVTIVFEVENMSAAMQSASADSLLQARQTMKKNVSRFAEKYLSRQERTRRNLPPGVIRENYHILSLPGEAAPRFRDDFTVRPGALSSTQYTQMWLPFYDVVDRDGLLQMQGDTYKDLPTWAHTSLGSGDVHMNHAMITVRKGELLGRRTLRVRGDYIGYEGDWTSANETASSVFLSASDSLFGGQATVQMARLSDEVPYARLPRYADINYKTMRHYLDEMTLRYAYGEYAVAFRHQHERLDRDGAMYNEVTNTGMLSWRKKFARQYINARVESSYDETIWTVGLHGGASRLRWRLLTQAANTFDPMQRHMLSYRLTKWLKLQARYLDDPLASRGDIERGERAMLGGVRFNINHHYLTVEAGPATLETVDSLRSQKMDVNEARVESNLAVDIGPVELALYASGRALDDDTLWYQPHYVAKAQPQVTLHLPYSNHIAAGLWANWLSTYLTPDGEKQEDSLSLDAWLEIGITRSFAIRGEAFNLTNAEYLLGHIAQPTHVNVTLRWTFVN